MKYDIANLYCDVHNNDAGSPEAKKAKITTDTGSVTIEKAAGKQVLY